MKPKPKYVIAVDVAQHTHSTNGMWNGFGDVTVRYWSHSHGWLERALNATRFDNHTDAFVTIQSFTAGSLPSRAIPRTMRAVEV